MWSSSLNLLVEKQLLADFWKDMSEKKKTIFFSVDFPVGEQRVNLEPPLFKYIFPFPKRSMAVETVQSWRNNHQCTLQTSRIFLLQKHDKILCIVLSAFSHSLKTSKLLLKCFRGTETMKSNTFDVVPFCISVLLLKTPVLISCQKEEELVQGISNDIHVWWCKNWSSWGTPISSIKVKSDGWMKVCCLRIAIETCITKAILILPPVESLYVCYFTSLPQFPQVGQGKPFPIVSDHGAVWWITPKNIFSMQSVMLLKGWLSTKCKYLFWRYCFDLFHLLFVCLSNFFRNQNISEIEASSYNEKNLTFYIWFP